MNALTDLDLVNPAVLLSEDPDELIDEWTLDELDHDCGAARACRTHAHDRYA